MSPAYAALTENCTTSQITVSAMMLVMCGMISRPIMPRIEPPSIHGRRRPKREVVRSDMAPASGFPITEPITPTPVTTAKAASLPSAPAISSDNRGSRLRIGVKNASMMPRLASPSPAR